MIRVILEEKKGFSESRDSFEKSFHVLRAPPPASPFDHLFHNFVKPIQPIGFFSSFLKYT